VEDNYQAAFLAIKSKIETALDNIDDFRDAA
jgi:hypothetical protein